MVRLFYLRNLAEYEKISTMYYLFFFVFFCSLFVITRTSPAHTNMSDRCEPISISMCRSLPYNQTLLPNLLGHSNQQLANERMHKFLPLVKIDCSPHLQLFLCTLFAPVCTDFASLVPPCRNLCEAARSGCENYVSMFLLDWQREFDCSQFPTFGANELCIWKLNDFKALQATITRFDTTVTLPPRNKSTTLSGQLPTLRFDCPKQLNSPAHQIFLPGGRIEYGCGIPCEHSTLPAIKRSWLRMFTGFCAIVGMLATAFTLITHLADHQRLRYPERAIAFLASCQFIISFLHLIAYIQGDSLACSGEARGPYSAVHMVIAQGSAGSARMCTAFALLLYFCILASACWWCVLAFAWYLETNRRWSAESLHKRAHLLHAFSWLVPALGTLILASFDVTEGDPHTGGCFLGYSDKNAQNTFLFYPLAIALAVTSILLLAVLIDLWSIARMVDQDGKVHTLLVLWRRIALYGFINLSLVVIYLLCLFCERHQFDLWTLDWLSSLCKDFLLPCPPNGPYAQFQPLPIYSLKHACLLLSGLTSSIWLWSGKTWHTWCKLISRHKHSSKEKKQPHLENEHIFI